MTKSRYVLKEKELEKGFDMYAGTAYNTYVENNVGIESPNKLIEMLYEGVLRFNAQAKKAIKDNNIEKKFYWVNRSIAVIVELISALDMKQKGTIVPYLTGLYNYQIQLLSEAAAYNNIDKVDECTNVFKGLLEAWRETTNVA
jgi:flagellar protein FliS